LQNSFKISNWTCTGNLSIFSGFAGFVLLCGASLGSVQAAGSNGLTLVEAEHLALTIDPLIARNEALQRSLSSRAVSANTWPDPKIRFGVVNVPTGSYKLDEEAMTQSVIGISQALPPYGMTRATSARLNALSEGQQAAVEERVLNVRRQVRRVWLELYYQYQARGLVEESESVFEQLAKITQYQYRAGRGNQQHVVRAQLELSLLQDRKISIDTEIESSRATLAKWIGTVEGELDMGLPELPPVPNVAQIRASLDKHPALVQKESDMKAARHGIEIEESRYKPSWMVDVSYGKRDAVPDDVVSAMVKIDLPLFTGARQDKQVEASRALLIAEQQNANEKHRDLLESLENNSSNYQKITERLKYFETMLIPQAEQNTKAALNAYPSGVSDFGELVRARLTELESRLKQLRLIVNREKSKVDLLYLAGEVV